MSLLQEVIAQYANRSEVASLIHCDTRLTYAGYGHPGETRILGMETPESYDLSRKELVELSVDVLRQIAFSRKWIRGLSPVKTINHDKDSYGYKHDVEAWIGRHYASRIDASTYISSGCFVVAAMMEGLQISGTGNPCFNISKRSAKERNTRA